MHQVVKRISIIFLACFVVAWNIPAFADQFVHGYMRSNGTYVRPYYRSSPNGTVTDNFSYKGNINLLYRRNGHKSLHTRQNVTLLPRPGQPWSNRSPWYIIPAARLRRSQFGQFEPTSRLRWFQSSQIEPASTLPGFQVGQPLPAPIQDDRAGRLPSRPLKVRHAMLPLFRGNICT
jgi:hypothetical protein